MILAKKYLKPLAIQAQQNKVNLDLILCSNVLANSCSPTHPAEKDQNVQYSLFF